MDLDSAKENIQPLASGRNMHRLELALSAESQQELNQQRREYEEQILNYTGDDPLDLWYDYVLWVEQCYPKSGKESALDEIIQKCLTKFELDDKYKQDPRMVKLYIKFIDSQQNPQEYFQALYSQGIGTMVADLYLCWAHYYDICDNFEKTESIYRKGLDARAQPIEQLEHAHKQFGFSMSQRLLYKNDSNRQQFLDAMEERRFALTSLQSHKRKHVGSIRTGRAVKSFAPGRVEQKENEVRKHGNVAEVKVLEDNDMNCEEIKSTVSVVQSILHKKQENVREPGPWTNAKIGTGRQTMLFQSRSDAGFSIMEDTDESLDPLGPSDDNTFRRGIQLPSNFVRKNQQQTDFAVPHYIEQDIKPNVIPWYDKFMLFPTNRDSFDMEELRAYRWFRKRNIANRFTKEKDEIWQNGRDKKIRLFPQFCRANDPISDTPVYGRFIEEETLKSNQCLLMCDLSKIYPADSQEEVALEELLKKKWLNGEMKSQQVDEGSSGVEMDETIAVKGRQSIYGGVVRKSIVPGGRRSIMPQQVNESSRLTIHTARKSMFGSSEEKKSSPLQCAVIKEVEMEDEIVEPEKSKIVIREDEEEAVKNPPSILRNTGVIRKSTYYKRKIDEDNAKAAEIRNDKEPCLAAAEKPPPFSGFKIFEDIKSDRSKQNDEQVFKAPPPLPVKTVAFCPNNSVVTTSAVPEVDKENELISGEETFSTQNFNFFIKSHLSSTPKAKRYPQVNDENDPSPNSESAQPPQDNFIITQKDLPRQLSTIMETTESNTISSTATTTKSSVDTQLTSSPEFECDMTGSSKQMLHRSKLVTKSIYLDGKTSESMSAPKAMTSPLIADLKENYPLDKCNDENAEPVPKIVPTKDSHFSAYKDPKTPNPPAFILPNDVPQKSSFPIYSDPTIPSMPSINFGHNKTDAKFPIEPSFTEPKLPNKSNFPIFNDPTIPSMPSINFGHNKTDSKFPIEPSFTEPKLPNKSNFPIFNDPTIPSMPSINFGHNKTDSKMTIFKDQTIPTMQQEEPKKQDDKSNFPIFNDPTIPSMPSIHFGHNKTDSKMPIFKDQTISTMPSFSEPKLPNKSNFPIFNDPTIPSMPAINFGHNKTESNMPDEPSFTEPKLPIKSNFPIFNDPTIPSMPSIIFGHNKTDSKMPIFKDQTIPTMHQGDLKNQGDKSSFPIFNDPTIPSMPSINFGHNKTDSKFPIFKDQTIPKVQQEEPKLLGANHGDKSSFPIYNDPTMPSMPELKLVADSQSTVHETESTELISKTRNLSLKTDPSTNASKSTTIYEDPTELLPIIRNNTIQTEPASSLAQNADDGENVANKTEDEFYDFFIKTPVKAAAGNTQFKTNDSTFDFMIPTPVVSKSVLTEKCEAESKIPIRNKSLFRDKNEALLENRAMEQNLSAFQEQSLHIKDEPVDKGYSIDVTKNKTVEAPNDGPKILEAYSLPPSAEIKEEKHSLNPFANDKKYQNLDSFDQLSISVDDIEEQEDAASAQCELSIYVKRSPKFNKTDSEWDELTGESESMSSGASTDNKYLQNEIDFDQSQFIIDTRLEDENVDPFCETLRKAFLDNIDFIDYLGKMDNACTLVNVVRPIRPNNLLNFGDRTVKIKAVIGKGAFGTVCSAKDEKTEEMFALKQERPANLWEYYICLELQDRIINQSIISGFMSIDYSIIGNNGSIFMSQLSPVGTLLDVCNKIKTKTSRHLEESIIMLLTSQMLSIIDHLHACNIIHADIKPDNFLLMKRLNYDHNEICIQLIDFGLSIDLKLFRPGQKFTRIITTKNFTCTEMLENRPWTYQTDLYCLAGTVHTMLFGRYMVVAKDKNRMSYNITSHIPRYLNKSIWEYFFNTLINIRDCNSMPNLQAIRERILNEVDEKTARYMLHQFNYIIFDC